MLFVSDFLESIIDGLIADTDFLAAADAGDSLLILRLIAAPFTPLKTLGLDDLTFAPSPCFSAPDVGLGSPVQSSFVSADGNLGIRLAEPAGGFSWQVVDATNLPVDIYGVALVKIDAGGDDVALLATATIMPVRLASLFEVLQLSSLLGSLSGAVMETSTTALGGSPIPIE